MRWVCGDCGADVPTGEVACPACGSEDVRRAELTVHRCQHCGQDNRDPETECWNCGETGFVRVEGDPVESMDHTGVVREADADGGTGGSGRRTGDSERRTGTTGDGDEGGPLPAFAGLDGRQSVAVLGAVGLVGIALLAALAVGGVPGPGDDFVGYNETVSGLELGTVEYEVYRQVAVELTEGSALGRSGTLSDLVAEAQYTAEKREQNRPGDMAEFIRKKVRAADVGCPNPHVYTTKLTASEGRAIDQIKSEDHLATMLADRVLGSRFAADLREDGGRSALGLDVFVAADGDVHFGLVAC